MIEGLVRAALPTLLALALCGGCASSARPASALRRRSLANEATSAACMRPHLDEASPYHLPLAGPAQDPELQAYLADVPRALRRTLLASGLEPLFASLLREQARRNGLTLELLSLKQELSARLDALESQLASVLFEIDCTGDALESLLLEFERREHERELTLTISSLVVGAVGGVVAGAWDARAESKGPPIVAASGAGTSAALGVAAFVPKRQNVRLRHERNLLAPIRTGEDESHLYPTFVFRLMTLPEESGQPTPQRELLRGWDELTARSLPSEARAARLEVLYGQGGQYDRDLLKLREGMFDQLESRVTAFYRDLELLERYVAKVTEPAAPG